MASSSNHTNNNQPIHNRIIPGISKMTMPQTLSVIFSAYWERADLYTDVLALQHDNPSKRQLRLAFFRQGKIVLATPIEAPDDMTTISTGMKPVFAVGYGGDGQHDSENVVRSGLKVSRKAKLKFQAINLAYELLNDDEKRKLYDEWRVWNCPLPSPNTMPDDIDNAKEEQSMLSEDQSHFETLNNKEFNEIINASGGENSKKDTIKNFVESPNSIMHDITNTTWFNVNRKLSSPGCRKKRIRPASILREPTFGKDQRARNHGRGNNYRKIKWNEEVLELVIIEEHSENETRHGPLPSPKSDLFASFDSAKEKFDPRENVVGGQNVPDPYSNPAVNDDWFRTDSDFNQRMWDINLKDEQFTSSKHRVNSLSPSKAMGPTDSSETESSLYQFQLMDDSTVTYVDFAEPEQTKRSTFDVTGDDSLAAILDTPTPTTVNFTAKTRPWAKKVGEVLQHQVQQQSDKNRSVVAENTYVVGKGTEKNNVKINVTTYTKESKPKPLPLENSGAIDSNKNSAQTLLSDSEEVSLYSKETLDSNKWQSFDQADKDDVFTRTNDCAVFGQAKNCMFPSPDSFSIDVAKGFQATLSNYINAAVSDMKQGLDLIGHTLEENGIELRERRENPFLIQSFELDAMMNILQGEMENIKL